MDRIRRVWEVELTTVIEIRLLGHLRRILVSLGDTGTVNGPVLNKSAASAHDSAASIRNHQDFKELTVDLQKIVSLD